MSCEKKVGVASELSPLFVFHGDRQYSSRGHSTTLDRGQAMAWSRATSRRVVDVQQKREMDLLFLATCGLLVILGYPLLSAPYTLCLCRCSFFYLEYASSIHLASCHSSSKALVRQHLLANVFQS